MSSVSSTRGIFEAVMLTGFASHEGDDEAVNDAVLVEELALLDARFADLTDRFELAVKTRAQLEQLGIEDALEQIAAHIELVDREHTFRLCVRVMLADGKTEAAEAMVLGTLQELFALSPATVQRHLDEERAAK
jgi:hypothetical protein